MNSVLTLQLMGFFCYSNEIFCRDVGKYVLKQGDVHIHPLADNIRSIERGSVLRKKKNLLNTILSLTRGATPKFYNLKALLPKSDIKCI